MKHSLTFCLAALLLAPNLAQARPQATPTEMRWNRTDEYGIDHNGNGKIDENEWIVTHTTGIGEEAPPGPDRPLRSGETHRWSAMGEGEEQHWITLPMETIRPHLRPKPHT